MKKSVEGRIYLYLVAVVVLALSFIFDNSVASFFSSHQTSFLKGIFIFINNYGIYLLFIIPVIILLLSKRNKELLVFVIAFAFMSASTEIIKHIIARPRPFTKFSEFSSLGESANSSFPSGHASSSATGIRFFEFKKWIYVVWIAVTVFVMFSRVYLGMHYLSDVIAGAIVGYAAGDITMFFAEKFHNRRNKR